ncbi:MAG: CRISPR-associated protein Cas4 [Candidatus Helarchaeota archaeon]
MDINKIIDDVLAKDLWDRKIGIYYISEIPYCMRKLWYTYKYPKKHSKKTIRIFERGNILHSWIANILKKSEKVTYLEEEARIIIPDFKTKLILRGRVDDFIIVKNQKNKYVLEIKTSSGVWKQTRINPFHLMQITPYLMLENCDGKVIYIDSYSLDTKTFDVKFNWDILEEIFRRARMLHNCLKESMLPPPESKEESERHWECNFCLYQEECEKNVK